MSMKIRLSGEAPGASMCYRSVGDAPNGIAAIQISHDGEVRVIIDSSIDPTTMDSIAVSDPENEGRPMISLSEFVEALAGVEELAYTFLCIPKIAAMETMRTACAHELGRVRKVVEQLEDFRDEIETRMRTEFDLDLDHDHD